MAKQTSAEFLEGLLHTDGKPVAAQTKPGIDLDALLVVTGVAKGTVRRKPVSFYRVKKGTERLRVDAYIRVSTDSSDQENSYETQERFEKEWLDTADPTSAFILTTLAAIAQEESRSIS